MTATDTALKAVLDSLRDISVATLVDALNRKGYRSSFMVGVRSLTPGRKLVGRAVTLRFLPNRPDLLEETRRGPDSPEYRAMDLCGPGYVLVVDGMGLPYASIGGEIKFHRLKQRQAEGIVTDAAVREAAVVQKYGLKLFAQNSTAKQGTTDFLPLRRQRVHPLRRRPGASRRLHRRRGRRRSGHPSPHRPGRDSRGTRAPATGGVHPGAAGQRERLARQLLPHRRPRHEGEAVPAAQGRERRRPRR